MQLIRGIHNLHKPIGPCVITIGNFDGVHLGHAALLKEVLAFADENRIASALMTFEPQPNEYFNPDKPVARLMRFREKYQWLVTTSLDYLICARFNKKLASLSPQEFVESLLVQQLNVKAVIVGDDFRFGAKRAGDFALLQALGEQHQFVAKQMTTYTVGGERVSSTRVREALSNSDFNLVHDLLGRPYHLSGQVVHGKRLGREWGFPTANIHLHRRQVPVSGIFVVRVWGLGSEPVSGVANIGTRPTVDDSTRVLLEAHLFDFDSDLYGRHIEVELLHKLREEIKYDDVNDMIAQMHLDVEQARTYFKK